MNLYILAHCCQAFPKAVMLIIGMEILGLVENMSVLQCPCCGKIIDVFKRHGGRLTAENEGLPLLATLLLVPEVVNKGDSGDMSLLDNRGHAITQAFKPVGG
jgi:hypothetical protein